ncbi:histidine phosphatase family protein [Streptomyces aidingensis]|uniref:histidine phosphatase family protein n=1 Tax=Streptomyces aidingensis TaxID=910347 RepID=UPI001587657F
MPSATSTQLPPSRLLVLTSNLYRAMDAARIAFAGTTVPIHQDHHLRESDYGHLNNCGKRSRSEH